MEMLMPDAARDALEQYVAGLFDLKNLYSSLRAAVGTEAFEGTRSCWENMKSRCRRDGYAHIADEFRTLPDFIQHMGFRPDPSASIHRKNNDLGYSPQNCEWADKKTQSRERRNAVMLTCDGLTLPLVEWAERRGIKPSLMRRQHQLGWSDEEVVKGSGFKSLNNLAHSLPTKFWSYTPWPFGKEIAWEQEYQDKRWNGEHRLDFYIRTINKRIKHHQDKLEQAAIKFSLHGEYATSDQIPHWHQMNDNLNRWRMYYIDAHKKLAMLAQKERPRFADVTEYMEKRLTQLVLQAKKVAKK